MSKRKTFEVIQLAAYYEKIFSDEQIKMYTEDLSELTDEETIIASKMYRSDPENQYFPRPMSKLISLIKKPISNEDKASQLAALILKAIGDYGPGWLTSPTFQNYDIGNGPELLPTYRGIVNGNRGYYLKWDHAAISVFGIEGLAVISKYGGWHRYCEIESISPDGVIRQQTTKISTSLMNTFDKIGSFEMPKILSQQENNLIDFKTIIKHVPK